MTGILGLETCVSFGCDSRCENFGLQLKRVPREGQPQNRPNPKRPPGRPCHRPRPHATPTLAQQCRSPLVIMRASACLAAAVFGGAGSLAPGAQALSFGAPARARTGTGCQHQGGSFCSGVSTASASGVTAGTLSESATSPSRGWAARGSKQQQQGLAMSAAVTEKKLPWLEGTQQQKLPDEISAEHPLRVVIAGGGVGGLLSAKYLKMQGYDVSLPYDFLKIDIKYSRYVPCGTYTLNDTRNLPAGRCTSALPGVS